jgi:hypothetical protein
MNAIKILGITCFFLLIFSAYSQDSSQDIFKEIDKKNKKVNKPDQLKEGWTPAFRTAILLTQSSYTNWTRGGENSFAWTFNNDGQLVYLKKSFEWLTGIKTAFGMARVGAQEFRKTEDRLELESLISRQIKKYLAPFFSIFVQTQFTTGYRYQVDPGTSQQVRIDISNFWDPAYLFQTIGFRMLPLQGLDLRLGFAAKEVMTKKFRQYSAGKRSTFYAGMELVANLNRDFFSNTRIKSDLRFFSSFGKLNKIQMVWDNQVILKFNKIFSANVRTLIYYETDISSKIQLQEILGIGISYILFD